MDIGEGFSIKRQIFTLACNLSDTKQGHAQATWRRHMGDGCTPLRVVPHNVLGAVHLVSPHSAQPLGVLCPVCRAHFTRMCGELAVPLAQQVHQSHLWQTLGLQRLCCPLCLSKIRLIIFSLMRTSTEYSPPLSLGDQIRPSQGFLIFVK